MTRPWAVGGRRMDEAGMAKAAAERIVGTSFMVDSLGIVHIW
jgi:hypothetical protein